MSFLSELKRRKDSRLGIACLVVACLVMQFTDVMIRPPHLEEGSL